MGALFRFPPPAAERCMSLGTAAALVVDRLGEMHAPVLEAATQLLKLDDASFSHRLDGMRDPQGNALVHDLATALRLAAADFETAREAVFLARARLAAGIAVYGGIDER